MKKKINLSKWVIMGLGIGLLSSCSDSIMNRINNNPDNPLTAASKFVVSDLETSTAFNVVGSDLSFYASLYMEHEVGTYGQMYDAELRQTQPVSATTYDNAWIYLYNNLKNAKIVIKNCSAGGPEAGNNVTKGVAEVLAAYNSAIIADMFGDAPYSQAADLNIPAPGSYLNPKIDTQQSIYQAVFAYLDQAITDLQGSDAAATGPLGTHDFIFGNAANPAAQWIKFAYGLKARYTMHLLYRSANQAQDLQNIIAWANKSFNSASDDAKYAVYQGYGSAADSPFAEFYFDRDYFSVSQSFVDKLVKRNDPRASVLFMSGGWSLRTDPSQIYAAPNGNPTQQMDVYDVSVYSLGFEVPTDLLSYHELQFLKAEAFSRLGNQDSAWACMSNGVRSCIATKITTLANIVNTDPTVQMYNGGPLGMSTIPDSAVVNYLNNNVKRLFQDYPTREIMVQKYLALYGGEGEALEVYNDYRRLKAMGQASFITLENPLDATKFPLRYTYGTSDVTANPNVANAYGNGQYVYTDPVWWAGGTH
ncbi:MAG: SusD/RagB family nutrient-binding outer membrane lipoprotein [Microbacter sp.]